MLFNTPDQFFYCIAFNVDGRYKNDEVNITCTLSKDGGARVALTDTNPTELRDLDGNRTGMYAFALTQEETNAYELAFIAQSTTPGVQILGDPSNIQTTETVNSNTQRSALEFLVIGDDYLSAIGNQLEFTFVVPSGFNINTGTGAFGGAGKSGKWLIEDCPLVDLTGGLAKVVVEMGKVYTQFLKAGKFNISVEIRDTNGNEKLIVTDCIRLIEKQT